MFNEDSRVKIPAVLHIARLGYTYLSKKDNKWDKSNNIFPDIFAKSIEKINPGISSDQIENLKKEISLDLSNQDLGYQFYNKLVDSSGIKLIDFDNVENNTFNVLTELTYEKDDEEFRPDITLLINGIPLVFIEVKKPNNKDGILAEQNRLQSRFKNKKFLNFINITQLVIFSNNMEYDDESHLPIEGAFYTTSSYKGSKLNYFREENQINLDKILKNLSDDEEDFILKDNNIVSVKTSQEFITNKEPSTPTNRICTSLLKKDRLLFFLKYGIAYLKKESGYEKHIIRYPQFYALNSIIEKIDKGIKKGVIWHTQGSGKTALAYYSVKLLADYFRSKKIISKYYFIVDRIDLLEQASKEFRKRGLVVHNINSREEFSKDINSSEAIHNDLGKDEITVVNIQKFKDQSDVIKDKGYNVKIQRIYFLDEVHRSYSAKGSFLANLEESDTEALKIGLTGTPLLGKDSNTRGLFGEYIHKYFYNASIADGYTLRLIREEIENKYKSILDKTLKEIEVLKGSVNREDLYADRRFVEPMLDYIVSDFEKSRLALNDNSIGGMVVCDSYDQATMMYEIFKKKYLHKETKEVLKENIVKSANLILYDSGTKEERKNIIENFKDGKIDLLFVYNMLLTGFDAPRLKKIYLGRQIKSHNLLQALTRVNRTYKDFRYGYVVDFANIEKEFELTNKAYFDELELELGDEVKNYTNMFKSVEEINQQIEEIKEFLFKFDTNNVEIFSQQINLIEDRTEILDIVKNLRSAKELYNVIRLTGNNELIKKLDFKKISTLYNLSNSRLSLINTKNALENKTDVNGLLNIALEDVVFAFKKVKEEELIISDEYRDILKKTRESLNRNIDKNDPKFINLREELERLFKKKNLTEITKDEMKKNIEELKIIFKKSKALNNEDSLLKSKYDNDEKFVRLHKRLSQSDILVQNQIKLFQALKSLKQETDNVILKNSNILENEGFTKKMVSRVIIEQLKNKHEISLDLEKTNFINNYIVNEYMNEFSDDKTKFN